MEQPSTTTSILVSGQVESEIVMSLDPIADLNKALAKYQEAKHILNETKSELSHLAYTLKDMSVQEALRCNLIRFNFPIHPGARKAIIDND